MPEGISIFSEQLVSQENAYSRLTRPAKDSKRVVDYLHTHPFCQKAELFTATGVEFATNQAETTYLATGVLTTRTQVTEGYRALQAMTGRETRKIAEILFQIASQKDNLHPLEMGFLDNPFALVVFADRADFKKLHSPDAGGYYLQALKTWIGDRHFTFPFIAVDKSSPPDYVKSAAAHEFAHADMQAVEAALSPTEAKEMWGTEVFNPEAAIDKLRGKLQTQGNLMQTAELMAMPEWGNMIRLNLHNAKHEVLARLIANQNDDHFQELYKRQGLYDYLQNLWKLAPGDIVGDALWQRYQEILHKEVDTVLRVNAAYKSLGLTGKRDLLPWQLSRLRLGTWTKSLRDVGIAEEVELLDQVTGSLKRKANKFPRKVWSFITGQRDWQKDPKLRQIASNPDVLLTRGLKIYLDQNK